MILGLRLLFLVVLGSMLWVTTWASSVCPLFAVPRPVATHPWFLATMADAYWGFLTFYVWVVFKQTSWCARAAWLVAILLLGNIAMASYCLSGAADRAPDRPRVAGLGPRHAGARRRPRSAPAGLTQRSRDAA